MTDQAKKYLSDIKLAIEMIESFTADIQNFDVYLSDYKTQSAVERQLAIIGEAINKFEKLIPTQKLDDSEKIVGLRNRIVHSYDQIDASIIWVIINKHIAPLKKNVETLLA